MKRLLLVATSTAAIALTSLPVLATDRVVVTDTTGPNVTDPSGGNVTDPSGGNVTDPPGGNKPGKDGRYPRRYVKNRDRARDGNRVSKQLRSAQDRCRSGGDCAEFKRLYSEGVKHREELRREKPVRDTSSRLW